MIRKVIHVDIYNYTVVVYIADTTAEAIKQVETDYSVTLNDTANTVGRMVVLTGPKQQENVVIMLAKDSTNATVAHECLHSAYYILDYIGQECTEANHEVLAYLMSFLIKEIDKIKLKYASTTTESNKKLK